MGDRLPSESVIGIARNSHLLVSNVFQVQAAKAAMVWGAIVVLVAGSLLIWFWIGKNGSGEAAVNPAGIAAIICVPFVIIGVITELVGVWKWIRAR